MKQIQTLLNKFIKSMELSAQARAEQILRDYNHIYRK